jgi:hypothetical protein
LRDLHSTQRARQRRSQEPIYRCGSFGNALVAGVEPLVGFRHSLAQIPIPFLLNLAIYAENDIDVELPESPGSVVKLSVDA